MGKKLNQPSARLNTNKNKIPIKVHNYETYIQHKDISNDDKKYLKENKDIYYNFSTDLHVFIDNQLAIAIECKAYTESAMFKRILFDSMLMDEAFPNTQHCLFQLENALPKDQYHVLTSYHTHNIDILTLLEGPRNSKRPIHHQEYFKELKKEKLLICLNYFETILKEKI